MDSIVISLQKDILENKNISLILNKALLIANELEIKEFQNWINLELNGYGDFESLPPYRIVECELRGDFIQQSWGNIIKVSNAPVVGLPDDINNQFRKVYITHSLLEIIRICENNSEIIKFKLDFRLENILRDFTDNATDIYRLCPIFKLEAIIEHVKKEILNWTSELKKKDILGKSLCFSDEEKNSAKSINFNYIVNYSGIQIGENNQINTNLNVNKILSNLDEIKLFIKNNEFDKSVIENFNININSIENELQMEEPNWGIVENKLNILKEFAKSVTINTISSFLIEKLDIILSIISNISF